MAFDLVLRARTSIATWSCFDLLEWRNCQSVAFLHAAGFMPGVLTITSRMMVTIPRDKLGGISISAHWQRVLLAVEQVDTRQVQPHRCLVACSAGRTNFE